MPRILSNLRNIFISCGGLKGCSAISFLQEIEPLFSYNQIENLFGSSIGGIILSLWNLGYSFDELYQIFRYIPFSFFQNVDISLMFEKNGLDSGENYHRILISIFQQKNISPNITLLELYNKTNKNLYLATVNITTQKPVFLSHHTHPNIPVLLAIRMTSCIPYFYVPIEFEGNLYIDGGILRPFPLPDHIETKEEECLAILLQNKKVTQNRRVEDNILSYSWKLFELMFHQFLEFSLKNYKGYLIEMDYNNEINDIDSLFRFEMTKQDKDYYFNRGYEVGNLFIQNILTVRNHLQENKNKKIQKYFSVWKNLIHDNHRNNQNNISI
jgi:predicted acylesterase/phospholipase RssA